MPPIQITCRTSSTSLRFRGDRTCWQGWSSTAPLCWRSLRMMRLTPSSPASPLPRNIKVALSIPSRKVDYIHYKCIIHIKYNATPPPPFLSLLSRKNLILLYNTNPNFKQASGFFSLYGSPSGGETIILWTHTCDCLWLQRNSTSFCMFLKTVQSHSRIWLYE